MWRSLGFPEVGEDEARFTDGDIEAARSLARLTAVGLVDPGVQEAVARATAQSTSQLAQWQVGMLRRILEAREADPTPEQALQLARETLPILEQLQTYVWRRHLAATVERMLMHPDAGGARADTEELTVGFADMVGFTRTTRQRSVAELSTMIERFGAATTEAIAQGGGRLVKTVGDEVLFVTTTAESGAAVALALRDAVRAEATLPELRIGLAAGPVLAHYGDVYGEVVNIAARLTSSAHPDTILVDREIADTLDGDVRFVVRSIKPISVRGYRRLHAWTLDRATPDRR